MRKIKNFFCILYYTIIYLFKFAKEMYKSDVVINNLEKEAKDVEKNNYFYYNKDLIERRTLH